MREQVIKGLCFCYRTMVASEPLLEFAIPKSSGAVKDYYVKHLEEERSHEVMLADDLKRLGVEEIPYNHDAAKMAGAQYYLIAHDDPALLLGYMKALERNPITSGQVKVWSESFGTPLTCLSHHAEHDSTHKQDLEQVIGSLDPALRERVEWNERKTLEFLSEALR